MNTDHDMYTDHEIHPQDKHSVKDIAKECVLMVADHLLKAFIDTAITRYEGRKKSDNFTWHSS